MRIKSISAFFCLLIFALSSNAQDTLYFDKDWKESTKADYAYYRPLPLKKVGELLYMQDYYKNGHLQMQGYVWAQQPDSYVGDIYWYDEHGLDNGIRQYINKSTVKTLTYYNTDGTTWQTITYGEEGKKQQINTYWDNKTVFTGYIDRSKKLSGTFPSEYYANYHIQDYEENRNEIPPPTIVEAPPVVDMESPETIPSEKPAFNIVTLWQNGRKAQEITYTYSRYDSPQKLYTKTWDKSGKLLAEINHFQLSNNRDKVHTEVDFYRQNYFASQIKGTVPTKHNSRHGLSIFYYPDGHIQTEEQYNDGVVQKIKFYHNDGTLDTISTYKDGVPFDGKFSDLNGDKEIVYSMTNGQRQGHVYAKNIHTDEIITQGEYRDNEPFEGSFLVYENGYSEKWQFKKGKRDGLQTIYFDNTESILEEYEMKNGLREGFRKIYKDGQLKYESVYKDDKVQSGTVFDDLKQATFQNGHVSEIISFSSYGDEKPISLQKYTDNQLSSVTYYDFTIDENTQNQYTGIYKNGQPYEGYFKLDPLVDKISLIDYFENGELKYKYSFDFLEQLENYEHYLYNLKTTFQKGKVLDGPTYKLIDKDRLIVTHYQDGQPVSFDVNLFAMHYFNRIMFKKDNNSVHISEMMAPLRLEISTVGNAMVAKLYKDDMLLKSSKPVQDQQPEEGSPLSVTLYYLENNQIQKLVSSLDTSQATTDDESINSSLLGRIFYLFPLRDQHDLDMVFNHFLSQFEKEDLSQFFEIGFNNSSPINNDNYLTYVEYDAQGKAYTGVKISEQKDGTILLEALNKGKVFDTVKVKNIKQLLADDKATLHRLENAGLNMD